MGYYIALFILVDILILIAFIAMRPAAFRIERSAEIGAPPHVVFALINDFRQWAKWSPWEKLDATMKKNFEGPASGRGAVYSWAGNKKVGEGRMTILESKPVEVIAMKLEFFKPFAATNEATFTLTPTPGGTMVNWRMDGKNNFMGKAFSMVMNMDKLVGKDFEQGLANLNTAAQGRAS